MMICRQFQVVLSNTGWSAVKSKDDIVYADGKIISTIALGNTVVHITHLHEKIYLAKKSLASATVIEDTILPNDIEYNSQYCRSHSEMPHCYNDFTMNKLSVLGSHIMNLHVDLVPVLKKGRYVKR